jgi:hypothetical protein
VNTLQKYFNTYKYCRLHFGRVSGENDRVNFGVAGRRAPIAAAGHVRDRAGKKLEGIEVLM